MSPRGYVAEAIARPAYPLMTLFSVALLYLVLSKKSKEKEEQGGWSTADVPPQCYGRGSG